MGEALRTPERIDIPSAADPDIAAAAEALRTSGYCLLHLDLLSRLAGAGERDWARFRRNWQDLRLDRYMGDGGTYRMRRFGQFRLDCASGELTHLPLRTYRQEADVNPLNGGIDRQFEPLTDAFLGDRVLRPMLATFGRIVGEAEHHSAWGVDLHPFRIITSAEQTGKPAPQGRHRDGVTYVATLLLGRTNVSGGESSIYTDDGEQLIAVTLDQPGAALIIDDRRRLHDVTPVRPIDPNAPAHRDVLLVDFNAPS